MRLESAAAAVGAAALFAVALIGAGSSDSARPTSRPSAELLPTLFRGQLDVDEGRARARMTAVELGAGYEPIRARLQLELLDGECPRPGSGTLAILGPSGDDGAVALRFEDPGCTGAVGTYEGIEGRWSRRSGVATVEADEAGRVVLGLYP